MRKIEKFKMESVWLLYFVLMEISIVGFVFVNHSTIIKHSTLIPIEVLNLFSNLHMIFGRSKEFCAVSDI